MKYTLVSTRSSKSHDFARLKRGGNLPISEAASIPNREITYHPSPKFFNMGPGPGLVTSLSFFFGVQGSALDQTTKASPWSENLQTFFG